MTIQAILFDLDGTLIDHYRSTHDALEAWGSALNKSPEVERWFEIEQRWFKSYEQGKITRQEQRRNSVREYLGQPSCSDAEADTLFEQLFALYLKNCQAFNDAKSSLNHALATGAKIGILTNGTTEIQKLKLERTGLAHPKITLLTSEELGYSKPDPRCYQAALERLGVEPSKTLMVGDNYANDVQAAVDCGLIARHLDRRRGQTLDHYPPKIPKLVVSDMDGTLLDESGAIPPGFSDIHAQMQEFGVTFVPASGRQYATLAKLFPDTDTFIAENGNVLVHQGEVIHSTVLNPRIVQKLIDAVRTIDLPASLVLCTADIAYIEDGSAEFRTEVEKYYASYEIVDNFDDLKDIACVKVALFAFEGSETYPTPDLGPEYVATISSPYWIDVMDSNINKGVALLELQSAMGIRRDRTAAFGDYLNDLEMMWEAELSFAVDNAHPILTNAAKWRVPSNKENGVIKTLNALFLLT
ncbi:Cof-type HAD-IIB family hydrolase [Corynebacterium freiburgense]|uniref:Cof-type HAD-IIB family hydrolase n=1 Tax=Corynebacterium freiburgense TaxID=556548 RepID=UPI0004212ADA|nr:Cof-type HAD-IIB family hydrolase [Corynebacterium freiburgense]WJZ03888.1 Flavin mononucleotide phosphatase YbjI [Corynebacterium freiburgense]